MASDHLLACLYERAFGAATDSPAADAASLAVLVNVAKSLAAFLESLTASDAGAYSYPARPSPPDCAE